MGKELLPCIASILSLSLLWQPPVFPWLRGKMVTYQVDGRSYEGYYVAAAEKAPLVILIHDWDGLPLRNQAAGMLPNSVIRFSPPTSSARALGPPR